MNWLKQAFCNKDNIEDRDGGSCGFVLLWQFDPEQGVSLVDQPMEIRKKCQAEAESIVKKTNLQQVL